MAEAARSLRRANTPQEFIDARVQEALGGGAHDEVAGSLSAVLGATGTVLLSAGVAWGGTQLLGAHPYVILVFLGAVALLASVLTRPGGFLGLLPAGVTEFLLRTTPFDLLHDDYEFQNILRRWGRLLFLAMRGPCSEREVSAVVEGIDPDFVDAVFSKSLMEWLPPGVGRLLSPEPLLRLSPACGEDAAPGSSAQAKSGLDLAAGLARARGECSAGDGPISAAGIARVLQDKDEERNRMITEPDILPAVVRGMAAVPLLESWWQIVVHGATALAAVVAGAGAYLALPRVNGLLHNLAPVLAKYASGGWWACGITDVVRADPGRRASRAGPAAAGVVSAGVSLAYCAIMVRRRLGSDAAKPCSDGSRTSAGSGSRSPPSCSEPEQEVSAEEL